jgi:hypothetical protein
MKETLFKCKFMDLMDMKWVASLPDPKPLAVLCDLWRTSARLLPFTRGFCVALEGFNTEED